MVACILGLFEKGDLNFRQLHPAAGTGQVFPPIWPHIKHDISDSELFYGLFAEPLISYCILGNKRCFNQSLLLRFAISWQHQTSTKIGMKADNPDCLAFIIFKIDLFSL